MDDASQNLRTPANFMKDDDVSQECKNMISSLPSEKDFTGRKLYSYQGSWYYPNTLQAILNFQTHFQARDSDIILASLPKSGTTWLKALAFAVVHRNNLSQECENLISSLPSEKDFMGKNLYSYQGSWYYPSTLQAILNFQKHFRARDSDIILASFPKSGTTWLKALVFAVVHRNKYAPNLVSHPLLSDNPHNLVRFIELDLYVKNQRPDLEELPSPRLFATHMPFQTLHDSLRDSPCKVVYMCRNIKDVLVSRVYSLGPFDDQVLRYWKESLVNSNPVLFMRYEEMIEKPEVQVMRLADFLGCSFTEEEKQSGTVEKILELCSFGNLSNLETNKTGTSVCGVAPHAFFRRGGVGDWKNHLTHEMARKLDEMVEKKLGDNGEDVHFVVLSPRSNLVRQSGQEDWDFGEFL
ncbi:hypothetical protein IGI04_003931 [Brassica rapa subsp. trilocularis]|uniref:Sulfotransferase n=1 Tax=Brassica rapa subsp. trilocularis TaxID=1813537 RepID=A0ABQ7NZW7_BRACM|nr:hypothetical protein IGI04_003931 [Brassica rapa subsp. trilocularis]